MRVTKVANLPFYHKRIVLKQQFFQSILAYLKCLVYLMAAKDVGFLYVGLVDLYTLTTLLSRRPHYNDIKDKYQGASIIRGETRTTLPCSSNA